MRGPISALLPPLLLASGLPLSAAADDGSDARHRRHLHDRDLRTLQTSDTTPPVVHTDFSVPVPGALIDARSEFVFAVRVTDDSGSIKKVTVDFQSPSGATTKEGAATGLSSDPDIWYLPKTFADSPDQEGQWRWRVSAVDFDKNKLTTGWSDFTVLSPTAAGTVRHVKSMITDLIVRTPSLAPKFVRLGFHDCVGGCDGCVDLSEGDNGGLDVPMDALRPVVEEWAYSPNAPALSRADIWALAALTAAEVTQPGFGRSSGPEVLFPMDWIGRVDCDRDPSDACPDDPSSCSETAGPKRSLPSAVNITTHTLLNFFRDEFDFSPRDTVAIMGSHTIGTAKRTNSGFDGPHGWEFSNDKFAGSGYYDKIVGGNGFDSLEDLTEDDLFFTTKWEQEFIDNRNKGTHDVYQWFHQKEVKDVRVNGDPNRTEINYERIIMTNADIALVRDFSGYLDDEDTGLVRCNFRCCPDDTMPVCPAASLTLNIAAEYKFNNTLWLLDFRDAFDRMLTRGEGGQYGREECADGPPCVLGGVMEVERAL